MLRKYFGVVVVLFVSLVSASCSGMSPTSPSPGGGGNGGGSGPPTDGSARGLSARYVVYRGDCPNDPADCLGEIAPTEDPALKEPGSDETYVLGSSFTDPYTVWLFVEHPGASGRVVTAQIGVWVPYNRVTFPQNDPSKASPVTLSQVFNMSTASGVYYSKGGGVMAYEVTDGSPIQTWIWKKQIHFRVAGH